MTETPETPQVETKQFDNFFCLEDSPSYFDRCRFLIIYELLKTVFNKDEIKPNETYRYDTKMDDDPVIHQEIVKSWAMLFLHDKIIHVANTPNGSFFAASLKCSN